MPLLENQGCYGIFATWTKKRMLRELVTLNSRVEDMHNDIQRMWILSVWGLASVSVAAVTCYAGYLVHDWLSNRRRRCKGDDF